MKQDKTEVMMGDEQPRDRKGRRRLTRERRAEVVKEYEGIFASLPGAGPVLAPRLLALFGERIGRYPDAASLQKYAGIAPVRERSQGRLWVHWRWAAPEFLRQTLVEWAGQTVPRCT